MANGKSKREKPGKKYAKPGTQNDLIPEGKGDFFVTGIGASAGGLEALRDFFSALPSDTGMAFIVVQHLSPDYKSLMDELLSRHTSMPIKIVHDGMNINPDTVYLIPPKKNMTIFHRKLYLTSPGEQKGVNLPIDIFFRSLADDIGKKSIGIILSGTGSDGSLGIRSIKEMGGMVMVQDDQSAKFDGMPKSSIATGIVDYVLNVNKMPEELVKYIKHPFIKKSLTLDKILSDDDDMLTRINRIIKERVGVDFTCYKPNTILRRLEKRISINQIENIKSYINFLEQSPQEAKILYKELLIGVTQFFRDKQAFELIKKDTFPSLFEDKAKNEEIRLWTVGCSTGEEAYSLAIVLDEYMEENNLSNEVKLFATDIDREAIEYASQGRYPESILSDVSEGRLEKYFEYSGNGFTVKENIRRRVIFAAHNIIKDPPFSKLDFISCRNMLIYLNSVMQKKIISMFYYAFKHRGILFLGSSESLGELTDGFDPISNRWKIFKHKAGFRPPVNSHMLVPDLQQINYKLKDSTEIIHRGEKSAQLEKIYEEVILQYLPSSVLVNESFDVVHILKDVNEFIHIPVGRISYNILKLVPSELSVVLTSMLNKSKKERKEVIFREVPVKVKEGMKNLNIGAYYIPNKETGETLFLISFEVVDKNKNAVKKVEKTDIEDQYSERFSEMEQELNFTKENLQATIEELETSNEELQSTNEELIASNEELQSTNEELQSVNEELYTVNSEYQNKIEELTQLNNDINNLLKNTNIGTLFLDVNLKIRKFTPVIKKVINLMDMDAGRPIQHLSVNSFYADFIPDIEHVLDTLEAKEKEIQDKAGNWYLLRILPYRTVENAVDGIIVTLVEINRLKTTQEELKREQDLLIRVLENSPLGKIILNEEGTFTYLNKYAEEVLEITNEDLKNYRYNKLNFEIQSKDCEGVKDEDLPFQKVIRTRKPVYNILQVLNWGRGKTKVIRTNGAPIFDEHGDVKGGVFSFEEITEEYKNEHVKQRKFHQMLSILENSPVAEIMVNEEGLIIYANPGAGKIFNEKANKLKGIPFDDLFNDITGKNGKILKMDERPFAVVMEKKDKIKNLSFTYLKNGRNRKLSLWGSPLYTADNKLENVVFTISQE